MIIGQARCPYCGYKTTTGGIGEHIKNCRKNPSYKEYNPELDATPQQTSPSHNDIVQEMTSDLVLAVEHEDGSGSPEYYKGKQSVLEKYIPKLKQIGSESYWKGMESAPKDGTEILVHDGNLVRIVSWQVDDRFDKKKTKRWCVVESEGDEQGGHFVMLPKEWKQLPIISPNNDNKSSIGEETDGQDG